MTIGRRNSRFVHVLKNLLGIPAIWIVLIKDLLLSAENIPSELNQLFLTVSTEDLRYDIVVDFDAAFNLSNQDRVDGLSLHLLQREAKSQS